MAKRKLDSDMAEQLRQAIRDCGMSLNEIERQSGVSHAILSRFLHGTRTLTLPLVSKLCKTLGLHLTPIKGEQNPRKRRGG